MAAKRRITSALLIIVFAVGFLVQPGRPGVSIANEGEKILAFESESPILDAETALGGKVAFPESIRAVIQIPEEENEDTITRDMLSAAVPQEEELERLNYQSVGNDIYTYNNASYRFYGAREGESSNWYALDDEYNIIGSIVDIPAVWDEAAFNNEIPGIYKVTLLSESLIGYEAEEEIPYITVRVINESLIMPFAFGPQIVNIDGITYELDVPEKTARVKCPVGGSENGGSNNAYAGDLKIPDEIEVVQFPYEGTYTVTEIGKNAFFNGDYGVRSGTITGLELPDTLTAIESSAFRNAFNPASGVDVSIPSSVTTIGDYAFFQAGFAKLTLNEGLVSIGDYAFNGNNPTHRGTTVIPASVKKCGRDIFSCLIPGSVGEAVPGEMPKITRASRIVNMNAELPGLDQYTYEGIDLDEYDSQIGPVQADDNMSQIHKALKWDAQDTEVQVAELLLAFEHALPYERAYDVVFVLDQSFSMAYSEPVKYGDYEVPAMLLQADIALEAAETFLKANGDAGYNNRVAFVGFSEHEALGRGENCWKSEGFSDSITDDVYEGIERFQFQGGGSTDYYTALDFAYNLVDERTDKSRASVVVFISDGVPTLNVDKYTEPADRLRDGDTMVIPLAIFLPEGEKNEAIAALEQISFDRSTVYEATDTDTFISMMEDIIDEIANIISDQLLITDTLTDFFEFPGGPGDITVSSDSGVASVTGNAITWNLEDCKAGVVHTLKARIELIVDKDNPIASTGILKTNQSLKAETEGISLDQEDSPYLERYIALYQFKDRFGEDIPIELMEKIADDNTGDYRAFSGGYRVGDTAMRAWELSSTQYDIGTDTWNFTGWNADELIIAHENVAFIGTWERFVISMEVTFTKVASENTKSGIGGAEFKLYTLTCTDNAHTHIADTTDVVDIQNPGPCWTIEKDGADDKVFQTDSDGKVDLGELEKGYYMLVETTAPGGYSLPVGQWMIRVDPGLADTDLEGYRLTFTGKSKDAVNMPNAVVREIGTNLVEYKIVNNKPIKLALAGFKGTGMYILGGIALMLTSICLYAFKRKKLS